MGWSYQTVLVRHHYTQSRPGQTLASGLEWGGDTGTWDLELSMNICEVSQWPVAREGPF